MGQGRHNFIFVLNEKIRCLFSGSFIVLNKDIYFTICEKKRFCLFVFNEETLTPSGQLENFKQG